MYGLKLKNILQKVLKGKLKSLIKVNYHNYQNLLSKKHFKCVEHLDDKQKFHMTLLSHI